MIKIPTESQKGLENLLKVKDRLETFQNQHDLNMYLTNVNRYSVKKRNLDVIFSNLRNNMIFKYSDKRVKKNIREILIAGEPLKELTKGEVFKLYLYLYESESTSNEVQEIIEKYSSQKISVTKESFVEFIVKESKNLYTKWNFPIEIKIEYKIFEDVVKELENPEVFKKLAPIILELGRYIDMKTLSNELAESVRREMLKGLPKQARAFFKKYNRLNFYKAERIDNIIFIFLKDRDIISLTTKKDKTLKIELLNKNRYNQVIFAEIATAKDRLREKNSMFELESFKHLARKMYESGYDIKWIEVDTAIKVCLIVSVSALLISGIVGAGYYLWNMK